MEYLGNKEILKNYKIGFICSRKVPANIILKTYDWAIEQRDNGICVVSGFHSKIEKDVFDILIKGKQPVILILARGLKQRWETKINIALDQKRLLVISPFPSEVKIFAIAQIKENDNKVEVLRGEKVQIAIDESSKTIQIPYNHLVFLPTIFLISIIIPFLRLSSRLKYNFSIILAFLFSVALIVAIARGISIVSPSDTGEILSLGFVNIFWGSYVPETQPEWLFSLTSANNTASPSGFGVPLWVLLLSVIGSSLFTLLIIVSEIKERPDFAKLKANPPDEAEVKKFREKIENIVRHQFYMLFSPLGAIFIYQLMVAAGAVGQPITVAIAALGAGSTMNLLLDKAVLATKKALEKTTLEEENLDAEMKEIEKIEAEKLKRGKQ